MDMGMGMDMDTDIGMDMDMGMGMDLGMDMDTGMGMDMDTDMAMGMDTDMGMDMDTSLLYRTTIGCHVSQATQPTGHALGGVAAASDKRQLSDKIMIKFSSVCDGVTTV